MHRVSTGPLLAYRRSPGGQLPFVPALPLIVAWVLLPSCGESPTDPGDNGVPPDGDAPTLDARHTLVGDGAAEPVAGGTALSRVAVRNAGDIVAFDVAIIHSVPDRFLVGGTSTRGTGPIETAPVVLAAGDSLVLEVELTVPALFPDGWSPGIDLTLRFDIDGDGPATPTDSALTPATTVVRNDGLDFSLVAPGVPEVYWAGEFSNWSATDPAFLFFQRSSGRERGITIPTTGRQEYKFVLRDPASGRVEWIRDPRAKRLSADGFGGYNSVAGVPLPPPVSGIPGGIDPRRVVIYELFTYDFSAAGDFQGVMDGLTAGPQDLADLGVNAVELLPVTGVLPGFNWGYEPRSYFAPEPDYGTPEDFAALVEAAHAQGVAVILDMVFNHAGGGWSLEKVNDMGDAGTYINDGQAPVFGMRQLNWYSDEMRTFLLEAALFWIEQYGVDGFRMDLVDQRDYAGYRWWRDEIKVRHPDFFLIGEDFTHPPNNSISVAGMDAQWGGQHTDPWGGVTNHFQNTVMALLKEGPYVGRGWFPPRGSFDTADNPMWALANDVSPTSGNPSFWNDIRYIVSHDEHRLAWEVENEGSPEAMAIGAAAKAKLGAAALLTATGVPMIYTGEEIAAANFVGQHPAPNKIDWAAADEGVRSYYRDLIGLRLTLPSLATGNVFFHCPDWSTNQGFCQQTKTICYWRSASSESASDVVVALNFDHTDHAFPVAFPTSGTWYRHDPGAGETPVSVSGGTLTVTMPASAASIYLKNPAPVR